MLRNLPKKRDEIETFIADTEQSIVRVEAAAKEPFAQAEQLIALRQQLRAIEADMAASPVAPPPWLRQGAPIDTEIYLRSADGSPSKRIVEGHVWNDVGYFISTKEGNVPYLEAFDQNGQRIYDPRPFTPPKVVEKPKDGAPERGLLILETPREVAQVLRTGLQATRRKVLIRTATSGPSRSRPARRSVGRRRNTLSAAGARLAANF